MASSLNLRVSISHVGVARDGTEEMTHTFPLKDENLKIVFVREDKEYHRHVVTTGIESFDLVEIITGMETGAVVVTKGNYQLKSKLKMSALDPYAGHVH